MYKLVLLASGRVAAAARNTNHYDDRGHKVGESFPSFWGGADHYGFDDDHDAIQDELDSFDDPEEAMAWLEDEGYDPDDFDF